MYVPGIDGKRGKEIVVLTGHLAFHYFEIYFIGAVPRDVLDEYGSWAIIACAGRGKALKNSPSSVLLPDV